MPRLACSRSLTATCQPRCDNPSGRIATRWPNGCAWSSLAMRWSTQAKARSLAVWEHGSIVRSLSVSPDGGIGENIGQPLPFEEPYWAGEHPVDTSSGLSMGDDPYPLPFHPLELGEAALRALFGFVIEGRYEATDVDTEAVVMHGFRAIDPSRAEQAEHERLLTAARQMRLVRRMHYVDGVLVEMDLPQ